MGKILKIHHVNCGTFCPHIYKGASYCSNKSNEALLVCHCLIIETTDGVILIDTGADNKTVINSFLMKKLVAFDSGTNHMCYHLEALGIGLNDVRHIIITHHHHDHIGALYYFKHAAIHTHLSEFTKIKAHYKKKSVTLPTEAQWFLYEDFPLLWQNLPAIRPIKNIPAIQLISLPGHTLGHLGVTIETPEETILHCGDAYFRRYELTQKETPTPFWIRFFLRAIAWNNKAREDTLKKIKALVSNNKNNKIKIFCSHDPDEFSSFQN